MQLSFLLSLARDDCCFYYIIVILPAPHYIICLSCYIVYHGWLLFSLHNRHSSASTLYDLPIVLFVYHGWLLFSLHNRHYSASTLYNLPIVLFCLQWMIVAFLWFGSDFFQCSQVRRSMSNILFVFAKAHPDISYKQVWYKFVGFIWYATYFYTWSSFFHYQKELSKKK